MKSHIIKEIIPTNNNSCVQVYDRVKTEFSFPIHFHLEYELTFIRNARGAKRVVGDHVGELDEYELVLVGSGLIHGWEDGSRKRVLPIEEVTIQFRDNIFHTEMLQMSALKPVNMLLKSASRGVLFAQNDIKRLIPKIELLSKRSGYGALLELQSLLYDLATTCEFQLLTNLSFHEVSKVSVEESVTRLELMYTYLKENAHRRLMLDEVAHCFNMTGNSFSRFLRQHFGRSFVEILNEIRVAQASKSLISSSKSITDICYESGFNNVSNFNRIFKRKQKFTPSKFRDNYLVG